EIIYSFGGLIIIVLNDLIRNGELSLTSSVDCFLCALGEIFKFVLDGLILSEAYLNSRFLSDSRSELIEHERNKSRVGADIPLNTRSSTNENIICVSNHGRTDLGSIRFGPLRKHFGRRIGAHCSKNRSHSDLVADWQRRIGPGYSTLILEVVLSAQSYT